MQLLLWPAYSPDMSPIEHMWDLVGRHLARDLHPAASKDELLLYKQAICGILVHEQTFKICLTPCHIVLLYVVATPNTDFGHLILFFFCFVNFICLY
ncbi:hypothetical protein TNCV_3698701 [Trichonephila clavipes]|uniref:Tc1-like transposase DDE domain-containing protein n=1 Tax=Trichonephila clavipes TaxID=2585209 RepID=A0A8X6VJF3_TRICX|nr:hypothetical protein TNCV_3698701 [Trichonephila clavipes]